MAADKKRKLEITVAALQDRWGVRAIHRLDKEQTTPIAHVSTSFSLLNEALVIGGLPRGRISEIIGVPTSGMSTIALRISAEAQESSATAIYIDLDHTFDPEYAARCGLELSRLILVRPSDIHQALAILHDFILNGGISIVVFDVPLKLLAEPRPVQALTTTLGRLITPLSRTNCVLLFLTSLPASSTPSMAHYPSGSTLPHHAAVRLFIHRERWIYQHRDISGYQAQVLVVKNKLGPAGKQASITITFDGNAPEDQRDVP